MLLLSSNRFLVSVNQDSPSREGRAFILGLVLIDDKGSFISDRTYNVEGIRSVFEAKMYGMFKDLSWTLGELQQPVIIKTESIITTKALDKQVDNVLEVGSVLQDSEVMLRSRETRVG
ncbi:hypothetical protein AgCh_001023 [Apium graveolens]